MGDTIEKKQDKKLIFTEFSNNITLITIGILSLGYLNQLIYYSFFSIPIYNYLQVSELITLFVPSLIGYVFQGLLPIAIIYLLLRAVNYTEKDKTATKSNSDEEDSLEIKSIINSIKTIRDLYSFNSIKAESLFQTIKNFFNALKQTFFIIIVISYKTLVIFVVVILLLSIYSIFDDNKVLYSQDHSKEFFDGAGVQAFFYSGSILFAFEYLNILVFKFPKNIFRPIARYILFFSSPVFFVILINNVITSNIKKGLADYEVEFKYDGKQIRTDTNIVYIGATQNYLFLRERITRKNRIYKIDKIDNLSMQKISYTLGWKKWSK